MAAAAALIHERGVAGATLKDIRTAAGVSGSQLSHYFAGKDELVQAVIGHQAEAIAGNQEQADLGSPEGLRPGGTWSSPRQERRAAQGGMPARVARRAAGRERRAGPRPDRGRIRGVVGRHRLSGCGASTPPGACRPALTPDDLAVTLLAVLQGGLLLAQVQRDARLLETAVDTLLGLAQQSGAPDPPAEMS